jgi:hypothetical protein
MKFFSDFLKTASIFFLLLPVFFIVHNYKLYYGLVSVQISLIGLVILIAASCLIFFLIFIFLRSQQKAALITTLIATFYLFFGNIKDFISGNTFLSAAAKYSIMVPVIILVIAIVSLVIIKTKVRPGLILFLNLLLSVFIVIDVADLKFKTSSLLGKNILSQNAKTEFNIQTKITPDVYYIVMDCYPSTAFLKANLNYDNSGFDSSLRALGFKILNSSSNYDKTAFSIPATLNFDYLSGISSNKPIDAKDYTNAMLTTERSAVPRIFSEAGYKFYNLSIFDFRSSPSFYKASFLTLPAQRILMYNSFWERFRKDVAWNFTQNNAGSIPADIINEALKQRSFNQILADSLGKINTELINKPKFIYAHLLMPHPPYFFNENGDTLEPRAVITNESAKDPGLFISYLKYTNKKILEIINSIKQPGKTNTVIILQSDHGIKIGEGVHKENSWFSNYTAVYFPGKALPNIPDSISNINTFPLLFNLYFGTKLPLKKDSIIRLEYYSTKDNAGKAIAD